MFSDMPDDEREKMVADWGAIFAEIGEAQLRTILFQAAQAVEDEGRFVVEFSCTPSGKLTALDVTDHLTILEEKVNQ